ncbi:MAG: hypothetical protein N2691_03885 [Patescibacteria group bacterium]|nr:hypothetical protein [Patescibacteria group bacterium]
MHLARPHIFLLRLLLIVILVYWTYRLIVVDPPWILLDALNLMIHELGHVLFSFFGEFMYFAGGTIGQLFFPVAFTYRFATFRDWFAVGFCLFWVGNNLINIGYYISDARTMALPLLLDGSIHDWNWMLGRTGLLPYDSLIGAIVNGTGVACALAGIGLCLFIAFWDVMPIRSTGR